MGCGDVRLLRTIRSVDVTGQERATLNKLIIGESLRARSRAGQETEAILACNILNQMTQLGRPASYAIGR